MSGQPRQVDALIVGAGMSGICMAATLKRAGQRSFVIIEKANDVGGTWRDNRYPGLTCDVPAPFYTYSFAPNPAWKQRFAAGSDVHRYLRSVFDKHGLREHTRFGTEILDARHDGHEWTLRCDDGTTLRADVVVAATGVLHHPQIPDIAGLDSFAGECFHSSRWPADLDVTGKRIGVIGTGSTGVQLVTALAKQAGHVTQFQRTPHWVIPLPNQTYSAPLRRVLKQAPALAGVMRRVHLQTFEYASVGLTHSGIRRTALQTIARTNLRTVRDPGLRAKLSPDYQPGCKRLVISAGYYRAVQRSNVDVVTELIAKVVPDGMVTADGATHELDILVLATGFDAQAYVRPMSVTGPDGATLADAWAAGPSAHLTVGIPGLPNFFLLMGPNSPIGNTSLVPVAEAQAKLVLRFVRQISRGEYSSIQPTAAALEGFQRRIRDNMGDTVWVTGCQSWYLDEEGTPNLWPWTFGRFASDLKHPRAADWATVE